MAKVKLNSYELKVLRLANKRVLRRRWYGWPFGASHRALDIQGLVDLGYLKFFYDWGFDAPCLKITGLGRSRLMEEDDLIPTF